MSSRIYQVTQRSHLRQALAATKHREVERNEDPIYTPSSDPNFPVESTIDRIANKNLAHRSKESRNLDASNGISREPPKQLWKPTSSSSNSPTRDQNALESSSVYSAGQGVIANDVFDMTNNTANQVGSPTFHGEPGVAATKPKHSTAGKPESSYELFKTGRINMDATTEEVLPTALKKYKINGDARNYDLILMSADRELLLAPNDRPLPIFKMLDRLGQKLMFILRKKEKTEVEQAI